MIIKRESSCFRPLMLKGKQLHNIIFYKDNNIVYASECGWLENNSKDVVSIDIIEPKKANIINLNRKDNYYIKNVEKYNNGFDLYIYINDNDIKVSEAKEIRGSENNLEVNYKNEHTINIPCEYKNCRLDANKELEYYNEQSTEIVVSTRYTRTAYKILGRQLNKLFDDMQSLNIDISKYTLEKILDKYTIERK